LGIEREEPVRERPATSYHVAHVPLGETLTVRSQPGLEQPIVGSLPANATGIAVIGPARRVDRGSWLPVRSDDLEGWVDGRFLELQASTVDNWRSGDLFLIPLQDSQGQAIGLIRLDDPDDGRRPSITTAKVLEVFANQTTTAIENARLVEQTLARSREVRTLFEAGHEVSSSLDQVSILRTMARYLLRIVDAQRCTVYAWDRSQKQLVIVLELAAAADMTTRSAGTGYDLSEMELANEVIETQSPRVQQQAAIEPDASEPSLAGPSVTLPPVVFLPITFREDIYGIVEVVCSPHRRQVTPNEIRLLSAIISQAAIALENAQLFQDTLQRELFFAALGRVTMAISVSVDLPTVLNLICQESLSLFEVDGAYIWHKQQDSLVALAGHGYASQEIVGSVVPLSEGSIFPVAVAELGEGILGNHFRREGTLQLRFPRPSSVEAVMGVPLKVEEQISGVLVLVDTDNPGRFGPEDLERATLFGMQAAIAIRNARMVTELRELNERLDVRVAERTRALGQERDRVQYLLRVTSELSASLDQHRVLYRALQLINEIVNATHGAILLVDNDTGRLVHPAAYDTHRLPPMPGVDMGPRPKEGLPGWIVKNRRAIIIDDMADDDRWTGAVAVPDLSSVMALPLISGDEVIGVLMLFHKNAGAFSSHQLELVEAAAMQVASAISNAQLYLLIRDQAERLGKMLREEHVEAAKNQAILESIADGVLVANARGQVVLANMSAAQILDVPRSQLLGKSVNELLGLYGSSGETWVQAIRRWARSTMAESDRPFLAERLTIEDRVVSIHLSPVFSQGQFFGTVSIFRDVTKEVEVDRMKSEFVSTVSHELRTPMTSIKGYADLMLMGASGPMSPTQSRYLRIIKNNADRMTMLINDVLDISRIESGKTELELQPVNIGQIIDQVITVHLQGRIRHEKKAIDIDIDAKPELPYVKADPTRLTQILTNLLDNAFHYTPPGGRIYVRASADEQYAYLSISDTGIGITKDDQAKIFDRFFRSEDPEVQRVPGTGLGLAIVRSLIEMHGGQIEVDSEPGRGSTFSFSLPLDKTEPLSPEDN
ncbi:MAG: GAF domain-containing protein, partial [Candidatus Promineifilaceae bacterium]